MIRVIEATPGSGKTCLVVEWLLREIERGFYGEYYANIEGLKVTGVRPLPEDWRDVNPEKSSNEKPKLLIIDEAQYLEPFMKENRSKNPIGKALSTHRHYGIDIWFITQSVTLLNDYVLSNCGEHVYLYRPRKKQSVKVFWWSSIQKSKSTSALKAADDQQVWRLNPNVFDYYISTSNVTDAKKRVSQKNVSAIITFVLVMLVIAFMVYRGYSAYTVSKEQSAPPSQKETFDSKPIDNKENLSTSINIIDPNKEEFSSLSPEPAEPELSSSKSYSQPLNNYYPEPPPVYVPPKTSTNNINPPFYVPDVAPDVIDNPIVTPEQRKITGGVLVDIGSSDPNDTVDNQSDVFSNISYSERLNQIPNMSYTLVKNTVIPCVLTTAIDSTISGGVSCQIPKPVYSSDGSRVLIPRGSVVNGLQNTQLKQGQARVSVIWNEIRTPKGLLINIDSPAVDKLGKAGLNAKVNSHFIKRLSGALLYSAVSDGVGYVGDKSGLDGISRTTNGVIGQVSNDVINIPPTAVVNHGSIINILVAHDIDFKSYLNTNII